MIDTIVCSIKCHISYDESSKCFNLRQSVQSVGASHISAER